VVIAVGGEQFGAIQDVPLEIATTTVEPPPVVTSQTETPSVTSTSFSEFADADGRLATVVNTVGGVQFAAIQDVPLEIATTTAEPPPVVTSQSEAPSVTSINFPEFADADGRLATEDRGGRKAPLDKSRKFDRVCVLILSGITAGL
jgi:hypothetical protein